jgi:SAM-dependent methyltransferase
MDFERLRRNWENFGRKDPMWAILTQPGTEGGRWDEDAFFRTGIAFVDWLGSWLGLYGIDAPKGRALDFGCGIGRLTQALAPHFTEVTGVDVSQTMVDIATAKNRHGDKVRFLCNPHPDLSLFADGSFDFVLSALVLRHMRAEYSLGYLREFLRVLRSGGLLFFQIATGERARDAAPPARAGEAQGGTHIEFHCAPAARVHEVLAAGGGVVLREEPDQWAGPYWDSVHCAVRKR